MKSNQIERSSHPEKHSVGFLEDNETIENKLVEDHRVSKMAEVVGRKPLTPCPSGPFI